MRLGLLGGPFNDVVACLESNIYKPFSFLWKGKKKKKP